MNIITHYFLFGFWFGVGFTLAPIALVLSVIGCILIGAAIEGICRGLARAFNK